MSKPLTIAIQLDGGLAVYDQNRGVGEIGRPHDGAREFCRWLVEDLKAFVIILTGRRREDLVAQWLEANEIKYHTINRSMEDESVREHSHFPIADVYLGPRMWGMQPGYYAANIEKLMAFAAEIEARGPDRTYDW